MKKSLEAQMAGKTKQEQELNVKLLEEYDYSKYCTCLTGFSGQNLQRIGYVHWEPAIRTQIGPRGGFKAGMTRLPNGKLIAAVITKKENNAPIRIYESADVGLTWKEISQTLTAEVDDKEPTLTALPDGSLVLVSEQPPTGIKDKLPIARSQDGGHTWEVTLIHGGDYPRNVSVETDGSLLMVRSMTAIWIPAEEASPNLELCRSTNGGRTWEFSEGQVDWDYTAFAEVSCIRLKDGKLLAALRRHIPGAEAEGEGFQDTVFTESLDDGKTWTKPWPMGNCAEVHVYLTELPDGRILATYTNYHLPWGIYAVISEDSGRTWDIENPIQLGLSNDYDVGWPVTLQLDDDNLITCYGTTSHLEMGFLKTSYHEWHSEKQTCQVVRWQVPPARR